MSALSDDTTIFHGGDVVFRNLDGEAVLVDLKAGIYFGLDEVGTRIWEWIGEHGRVGSVLDAIVGTYEVSREQARQDLVHLIEELLEQGLVRTEQAAAGA